jgi:hypothetical protein
MNVLEITAGVFLGEALFAAVTTGVSFVITKRTLRQRAQFVADLDARLRDLDAQGEAAPTDA